MGDSRYGPHFDRIRRAAAPGTEVRAFSDDDVVAALAAGTSQADAYLANVLATEAMNRLRRRAALVDALPTALVLLDMEGRVLALNARAEATFGWTSTRAVGERAESLPHECAGETCPFRAVLAPRNARAGESAWGYWRAHLIEREGVPYGAVVEIGRPAYALEDDEAQGAASAIAHDLREPARAVLAGIEGTIDGGPDAAASLALARDGARRLARTLDGLSDWARAGIPAPTELLRVSDVLDDPACRARYEQIVRERGAELVVRADAPRVRGAREPLARALGNLLDNAIRHSRAQRPRVEVAVEEGEGGYVEISVRDNGGGVPEGVMARVASLRADRPSTVRGGFGLAVAKRAVARLGGRLELESDERGAVVRLLVPRA